MIQLLIYVIKHTAFIFTWIRKIICFLNQIGKNSYSSRKILFLIHFLKIRRLNLFENHTYVCFEHMSTYILENLYIFYSFHIN